MAKIPNISLKYIKELMKPASIATLGGFRPPEEPLMSWFARGVGLAGEELPTWKGSPMFPLLQIRVDELPIVPDQLKDTALLVLFYNTSEHVSERPHGDGWCIREYKSLEGLQPLPVIKAPCRTLPIRWHEAKDRLSFESLINFVHPAEIDDEVYENFDEKFPKFYQTKVGGYPAEIQGELAYENFVFQVGSEEKAKWVWGDAGIGYFYRQENGEWLFTMQTY